MTKARFLAAILAAVTVLQPAAKAGPRAIPNPSPSHPGNIFVAGEQVVLSLPASSGDTWRLLDYEGQTVREGHLDRQKAALGLLPIGYYQLLAGSRDKPITVSLGVLGPLRAPTPQDSPIGIDVAMAWFFTKERMDEVANLCALAGMNRVRDRLSWEQMEPKRGEFSSTNQYDLSIQAQTKAGLQVLQVSHISARWANPDVRRFPLDLRDAYSFYREMARRWRGQIIAFEPWNEADIKMFGGHTGSEMATLQKAAYFGLKAGNSNLIACLNVFAIHRPATLSDFNDNQAWPYFDTFNLHHYEGLQAYPRLYADFRAISAGKPLWVSECSVHVKWSGDEQLKELSNEDARLQSERLTKTYALAIHQGAQAVFYFMLPHYTEGSLQYGLLHSDLTPRPGFLAAAAAGRLLAGAKPLGRIEIGEKSGQAYCFRAEPDGKAADVLVAWAKKEESMFLTAEPLACFDHLGRPKRKCGKLITVGPEPIFVVTETGSHPGIIPPPVAAKTLPGDAVPLVLQALLPEQDTILDKSAYKLKAEEKKKVPLFLYNFSREKQKGRLSISVPKGWEGWFGTEKELGQDREISVEIGAGERREIPVGLQYLGQGIPAEGKIRFTADFGATGQAILAIRMVIE